MEIELLDPEKLTGIAIFYILLYWHSMNKNYEMKLVAHDVGAINL